MTIDIEEFKRLTDAATWPTPHDPESFHIAARDAVPELVAEVERLQSLLRDAQTHVEVERHRAEQAEAWLDGQRAGNEVMGRDRDAARAEVDRLRMVEAQAAVMRGVLESAQGVDGVAYCIGCGKEWGDEDSNDIYEPSKSRPASLRPHRDGCEVAAALASDAGRALLDEMERMRAENARMNAQPQSRKAAICSRCHAAGDVYDCAECKGTGAVIVEAP